MYNHQINLEDIYNNIDQLNDNIDQLNDKFTSSCNEITHLLINVLSESRKTNILLKKLLQEPLLNNLKEFNIEKLKNHSFVLIKENFECAKKVVKELALETNKNFNFCNTFSTTDLLQTLTKLNVNDYVLINVNFMTEKQIVIIINAINNNEIFLDIGSSENKPLKVSLKPLNYVLYSDMLELVDTRLTDILEVVQ